jgi:PAS domain S-box-containing protein
MKDNEQSILISDKNIDITSVLFRNLEGYAIIAADLNGNITSFNKGACQIYGYNPDEVIDKQNIEIFFPPDFIKTGQLQQLIDDLIEKECYSYKGENVRKNGQRFPSHVLFTIAKNKDKQEVGFIEIAEDITERKKTEEALKKSEESYRITIIQNPDGITIVDKYGKIRFVNPAAEALFGRSAEELLGEVFGFPLLVEETTTIDIVRKDGQIAIAEMRVVQVNWEREPAYLTSLHDITELEKMQEQLIITDRLASIGQLASGVAHELNNPLTSVIGFSQMLLEKDFSNDVREDLKIINSEAQKAAQIVRGLLTFSHNQGSEKQMVNVNIPMERVLALRSYEQKINNIHVDARLAATLPEVMASPQQLQQVFINIIINAEQSMTEAHHKGTLTITTEQVENIIRISITDDGLGISQKNMGKLFTPFFTTKDVGKGTGLGLSICRGIITEHNGSIYAKSKHGKGSTFIIELPVAKECV